MMKMYKTIVVGYTSDGYYGPIQAGTYNDLDTAIRFPELKEHVDIIAVYVYDCQGKLVYPRK